MYVNRLEAAIASETGASPRLTLPWWSRDRDLQPKESRPFIDELGRSTGRERARLDADGFVRTACEVLGIDGSVLRSRRKDRETTRLRELVAAVGIERWGQSAGALGRALGKHPDMISRWARMAAARRVPVTHPSASSTTSSTRHSPSTAHRRRSTDEIVGIV